MNNLGEEIPLAGFPLCRNPRCGGPERWEATDGKRCAACGGPSPSLAVIRRTLLRQLKRVVLKDLPNARDDDALRFLRGGAFALGGLMHQFGFLEDAKPYMDQVFERTERNGELR